MKQLVVGLLCFMGLYSFSQDGEQPVFTVDASYFYGTILKHNPNIAHLITGHPSGVLLSFNKKTYGFKPWEQRYNYPDWGFSFIYQDLKNGSLGKNYSLYAHYDFYFLNRNLSFRIGQGLALTTRPYHKETNYNNTAYGSDVLSSTYFRLAYKKENVVKGLGFQAGLALIHYSNANFKAPNNSTNTLALTVGANYMLDYRNEPDFQPTTENKRFTERIKYNLAFMTGANEGDIVGIGQYPFYNLSFYLDKRLNRKSALQVGTEVFFSKFLKEEIYYYSVAYPEYDIHPNTDYKRLGVFIGHELFVNSMSVVAQLGYYAYYPYDFEGRVYNRIGLKWYFGETVFAALALKAHGAKAEAMEFGVGLRL